MSNKYDDIINLSRPPLPQLRHPMPMAKRAARFAAFTPLKGYKELIERINKAYDALDEVPPPDCSVLDSLDNPQSPKKR